MSHLKIYDVALCGAGIGGLTAAIALSARGFNVVIVERMRTSSSHGSGLQLGPNACHVLNDLGLITACREVATSPECIKVKALKTGATITTLTLGEASYKKYGAPYFLIHRSDLHSLLLRKVMADPAIDFVHDFPADHFVEHEDGVEIVSTRGQTYKARTLIGTDGLWSVIRKQLHGDLLPINSGQIAWRALVPMSKLDSEWQKPQTGLWLGEKKHLVTYPVKMGEYINLVAITRGKAPGLGWSEDADKKDLLSHFKGSEARIIQLINAIPTLKLWQLHDREPLKKWGHSRVSLLGDAAHPQLPHLAQGAAMAIEDAHVLAQCLASKKDDVITALQYYEVLRKKRTARVQDASREQSKKYHLASMQGTMRNLVLGMASRFMPDKLRDHYNWLYGANVVKNPSGSEV